MTSLIRISDAETFILPFMPILIPFISIGLGRVNPG